MKNKRKNIKMLFKINKWNLILGSDSFIDYHTDMADNEIKRLYKKIQRIYHASIGKTNDSLDDLIANDEGPSNGRPGLDG